MSNVPTNLIPTRITGLPEYTGTSTLGYIPYILEGNTYKVQFGQLAAVGAVPSSRVVAAGTGLTGGGDLSENRVISIANGGVGYDQLSATGVVAGTYGSGSEVPVVTVDLKGRVTDVSTTPLVITGYVPDSRLISTGAGLLGGGSLASNRTLSVDFSSATPQALGSATAGVSNAAARGDHVHPAVDLSDANQTQGALPLGRGGTGDALSPVAGAVVYSTGTKFALADPGDPGQVLTSAGTGEPYWSTVAGTGTVTSVSVLTANGFAGSVQYATTTPQITINTTVTGLVKGNGSALSAAVAGVDYAMPGANSDITSLSGITGGISTPDYVTFDTAATVTRATGRLWWDSSDSIQTLNLGMAGSNATLQIGEEMYFRVKASSAITEGQVVMFTGTTGNSGGLIAAPATGLTKDTASYIMGIATDNIALNGWGYITQFGLVRGINTTGGAEAWVDGQILYYNPAVPGGLTKTVPAAPAAKVEVAAVVHAASNGSIFVRPTARFSLTQLNDVESAGASNGDLLQYNGSGGYWQHVVPSTISVGTATNLAGGAANRIAYQTGAGATGFISAPTVANTYLEWSGSAFQWSSNPLGTVTSVAMSVPTGLTVSGSPITTSGTLAVGLQTGYSIPTTASQANWDTAYTDRLKWDGGSSGLVAATGRTSLGATTVGSSFFTLTNPSAITFPQINADNTVSALSAAAFRAAIGAGTGGGSVTSVDVSGGTTGLTFSGGPVTSSGTITMAGTLGVANGGTGATSLSSGYLVKGNGTSAVSASVVYDDGTNVGIGTSSPNFKVEVRSSGATTLAVGSSGATSLLRGFAIASGATEYATFKQRFDTGEVQLTAGLAGWGGFTTFHTNGTEKMRLDINGNLGIGTSSPGSYGKLAVTSATGLVGFNTGTSSSPERGNLWYDTDGTGWKFNIGKLQGGTFTSQMTFLDSGQIGIGAQPNTAYKVLVSASDTSNSFTPGASINVTNTEASAFGRTMGVSFSVGNSTSERIAGVYGVYTNYTSSVGGALAFVTNDGSGSFTERMRVDYSGNVGIGQTNPAWGRLEIASGSTNKIRLYNTTGNGNTIDFLDQSWQSQIVGSAGNLVFNTGGTTERMRITSGGDMGIGTSSPNGRLEVAGRTQVGTLGASNNAYGLALAPVTAGLSVFNVASIANKMVFSSGGNSDQTTNTELMCITNTGAVGIGTSSPNYKLDVAGDIALKNNATYLLGRTTGGAATRVLGINGGNDLYFGSIDAAVSNINFTNNGTVQAVLTSAGNFGIGTSTPSGALNIVDQNNTIFYLDEYSNADGAIIRGRRYRGTIASPSAVQSGDTLIALRGFGYTSAGSMGSLSASIDFYAAENFTSTAQGAFIAFRTNAAGGAGAATERMRIDSTGNVGIGTNNPTSKLAVYGNTGNTPTIINVTHGATTNTFDYASVSASSNLGSVGITSWATGSARAGTGWVQTVGAIPLVVGVNDVEVARFDTSGNLGIGTSSPGQKLEVIGSARASNLYINATAGTIGFADNTASILVYNGTGSGGITNTIRMVTNGAERARIDSSGNVGIGTSSPGSKLDVVGIIRGANGTATGDSQLVAGNTSTANNTTKYTSLLFQGTDTVGTVKSTGLVLCGPSDANWVTSHLAFQTRNADVLAERMRIDSSGNLLVGQSTSGPGWRVEITGSGGTTGDLALNSNASYSEIQSFNSKPLHINRQGNNIIMNLAGDYVGIGTDAPKYTLHTFGDGGFTRNIAATFSNILYMNKGRGTNASPANINNGDNLGGIWFCGYSGSGNNNGYGYAAYVQGEADGAVNATTVPGRLTFATTTSGNSSPTERMRINSSGYLLVGYTASNGAYLLQVNSQIFATNATIATSDGRYKENVTPLDDGLSIVNALNPVSFNWKEHSVHNFDRAQPAVGFIAQEVQQVLSDKPYLNSIVKRNECTLEDGSTEEFLGIAEGNMIAILVKAVQELTARVAQLEGK